MPKTHPLRRSAAFCRITQMGDPLPVMGNKVLDALAPAAQYFAQARRFPGIGRNEMDSYPTAMTEGAYFALVDNKTGDVLGRFVDPAAAQRVVSILNSTRGEPGRFRVEDTRPAHLRAAS